MLDTKEYLEAHESIEKLIKLNMLSLSTRMRWVITTPELGPEVMFTAGTDSCE
jgi:hypothetical protein